MILRYKLKTTKEQEMKVGNNENAGVAKMFFILECVGFTRMVSNSGLDLAPILSKKLKFMTGEKK